MDDIIVNMVEESDGVTRGLTANDNDVIKNLTTIYGADWVVALLYKMKKEGYPEFHIFHKYHQFVTYLQHRKGLGLALEFIDFHDNLDSALDRYLHLKEKDWGQPERDKIMELFQEIARDKPQKKTWVVHRII